LSIQFPHAWARLLQVWLAAAWAMSLTTLGLFVVPMLFVHLPTKALAGAMAAQLFSVQTGISTACALGLVAACRAWPSLVPQGLAQRIVLLSLAGTLLALLVEFAVAPRIVARDNLALWHGVGSLMFLLQWLCALASFSWLVGATRNGE